MVKTFTIVATIFCVAMVEWVDARNCDKALDEYLGSLALAAYASANLEYVAEVDQLAKDAKKTSATRGSCAALDAAKKSEAAQKLSAREGQQEAARDARSVEALNTDSEIDWEGVSGYDALTDLTIANRYAATVTSCNSQYPSRAASRTRSLEDFKKRIGYATLERKVEHFMESTGQSNEWAAMRMMGSVGEDTREWPMDKCDLYAKNAPIEQLYAIRRQSK